MTAVTKITGAGLGLRANHYNYILENKPTINWFEVLADNYMVAGGPAIEYLKDIAKLYPVVLHSVGLSIGSVDPLDTNYLQNLKKLTEYTNAAWVSDHLCWSSVAGRHFHDLLPLPFTKEVIAHVVARIKTVQDCLGQQILLENLSSYFEYKVSSMPEWDFINEIMEQADCGLLLDVNNVYVSAYNHDFSAEDYISAIDLSRVKQIHLAGYADCGEYLFDTHGAAVHQVVWDLYRFTINKAGAVPTLIEWDDNIPEFTTLFDEAMKAQKVLDAVAMELV